VLAGFALARVSAGLADSTIRNDTGHLGLIREWFGRHLWEMQPEDDAEAYFGRVLRDATVDAHQAAARLQASGGRRASRATSLSGT
jgi:hypothetical protein